MKKIQNLNAVKGGDGISWWQGFLNVILTPIYMLNSLCLSIFTEATWEDSMEYYYEWEWY